MLHIQARTLLDSAPLKLRVKTPCTMRLVSFLLPLKDLSLSRPLLLILHRRGKETAGVVASGARRLRRNFLL